jgi:ABC-type transporter Mla maintaining outer membrane lipid asymmetry ATPase subunit MlaF/ABC-type transporter Mla maintaining outer membrane lipid asymmetry permease subunit MlaE
MNQESDLPQPSGPHSLVPVHIPNGPTSGGIELRKLAIVAGERMLIEDSDARFLPGEITLVVGPSGVGKSILLKSIAGIVSEWQEGLKVRGEILIDGQPVECGRAGVVFQSFALFDELSPLANLEFAHASAGSHASPVSNRDLLNELRVPIHVPTSRLSGGQRQRLAIARTLAYNPPVILYDEPTSGLDPSTGQQVAQLIRQTHDHFGKTSVIVTHDYHSLMPIADRIFLLDPLQRKLIQIPRAQWERIPEMLVPMASATVRQDEVKQPGTVAEWLKAQAVSFLSSTTDAVVSMVMGLLSLIPIWKNPLWGMRFFAHFARLVFGPTAWLYLLAAGVIAGFVATYFTFQFLPYATYTEPLLVEDLLTALGYALYRIIVPVLACILISARCGAAVTADIGGRQYGNQIDALRTFGTNPRYYLLSPIIWAFLFGTPLLTFIAFTIARWTSLVTFVLADPVRGPDFWNLYFHRGLVEIDQFFFRGSGWLISKLLVCGLGTALIAYDRGRAPKYSSTDVSNSVTATILWSTLFVLVVHFVFALYEYRGAVPQTAQSAAIG